MTNELEVLRRLDFDWVVRLDEIWSDAIVDVPELHGNTRETFRDKLVRLRDRGDEKCPLGWVIMGAGGAGKTHLLNAFRRQAVEQNMAFVLVDMTDVREFWDTVLQGYIDSLQMPYRNGEFQYRCLLQVFLERLRLRKPSAHILSGLAQRKSAQLVEDIHRLLQAIAVDHRQDTLKYQDVVRAIVCLNSEDFGISNLGMSWLQGQEIDADDQRLYKFIQPRQSARFIVEAISWLMSLAGPTVLAFDQLDPLVQQLKYRGQSESELEPNEARSLAILLEVARGLLSVIDVTRRTQVVLSCIEATWHQLDGLVMSTAADRFEPPSRLATASPMESLQSLIRNRVAVACQPLDFHPPYPTWPFRPEAIAQLQDDTPREVLKKCHQHQMQCLGQGRVTELTLFAPSPKRDELPLLEESQQLTARFQQLRATACPEHLLEERFEDERIAPLLSHGLRCYLLENPVQGNVDAVLENHFPGGQRTAPLHARVRLVIHDEAGREDHYCVRALQHTHPRAYQARLNAAMTLSGIDPHLPYRHLSVVRRGDPPGGAITQMLTKKFLDSGGQFLTPENEDLRTLHALLTLRNEGHKDFDLWLRQQRPASQVDILSRMLFRSNSQPAPLPATPPPPPLDTGMKPVGQTGELAARAPVASPVTEPLVGASPSAQSAAQHVQLGCHLIAGQQREPVRLPVVSLEKHTVVLAGAGSGKTVFLRRMVEEAALCGVPSIVVDCANDLATFDERWPTTPEFWLRDDPSHADNFFRKTEMVVWTPGREDGNPLILQPIPDLAAVADNPQELSSAVAMVSDSLREIVAPGNALKAKNKHGILVTSLKYFAQSGGGGLDQYVDLLSELPPEAGPGVNAEQKLAREIADCLKVEKATNPLLHTNGAELDPAVLFGDETPPRRTRISVISLIGLPNLERQRRFLNQLAMQLFSWIKKHPHPPGRSLRGLLVIDEARDFVPSQKASVCKDSLTQLTAQARKYHLGLVFATQNPKDIDNKIIGNCTTHVYGKANAPASIDVIREQMQLKGGGGDDIAKLQPGQFYVHNADLGMKAPVKIAVPLCLSRHPTSPLEESEILGKARRHERQLPRCP